MKWNIFGHNNERLACYMICEQGERKFMLPALFYREHKTGVAIRYESPPGTPILPLADISDALFTYDGLPVYCHKKGDLYVANTVLEHPFAAELLCKIIDGDVLVKAIDKAEDWSRGGGKIPWKTILIGLAIAAGVLLLWQSGLLDDLVTTVKGL